MKVKQVEPFLKALPKTLRAVLFYGPDEGLVRERGAQLALRIVPDLHDPFNVADLSPARVAEDLALVRDELAALSLMGGRRLVRVRGAQDNCAAAIACALSECPGGDNFLIVEAGDLRPASPLRKLFDDSAELAAALPCYESDARERVKLAQDEFQSAGITASRDALQLLASQLAGDRALARQEIDKLIVYAGTSKRLELADIAAAIGDSATLELDAPVWAAADGNAAACDRALERVFADGQSVVGLIRAAQRHFTRLYAVVGSGEPAERAIDALRPPVFWKDKERLSAQCQRWRRAQLEKVLQRLNQLEADCKSDLPDRTVCARVLSGIAALAAESSGRMGARV